MEPKSEPATADITHSFKLMPHRSLSPRGFVLLMALVSGVSFIAGVIFWLAGAWPVVGFFGLDVALIYLAFKLNYAAARMYETIDISGDEMIVRRVKFGRSPQEWTFQPYWVRVEMAFDDDICGPLFVKSHGRRLEIGAFLPGEERKAFAEALRSALPGPV